MWTPHRREPGVRCVDKNMKSPWLRRALLAIVIVVPGAIVAPLSALPVARSSAHKVALPAKTLTAINKAIRFIPEFSFEAPTKRCVPRRARFFQ